MEILSIVVGFVGVIITLAANARTARRQQERQWGENRRALRCALSSELQGLYEILEEAIWAFDKQAKATEEKGGEPLGMIGLKLFEAPIYLASLTHLGQLTKPEIDAIVAAYQALSTQDQKIRFLLSDKIVGEGHHIPRDNCVLCSEALSGVLPLIAKALEEVHS